MSTPELAPRGTFAGVVAVWVVAALIGIAIAVFTPVDQRAVWMGAGLAGCIVLSFAVQLGYGRPRRFTSRVAAGMCGSLLVLGVISAGIGLAALITG
ncbi:hypothetical protein GH740_08810 [Microbacterium sp. SYP-A9085]|jgi:hypothetical protein|uniref:hypothetical protein n=1 Tax=Microbacterium sp. SYP-A9085 TaxID=2664454 RepID=UPI00129AF1EC|nr:hypothetical protein [Microbacterium sp. SYP-A9085]MRH29416.1 hypothetical protein [Microbacterium sp. SYP-A9085]